MKSEETVDLDYLEQAISLSARSVAQGGFPVGALIVHAGTIIGEGVSNGKQRNDATSHAEIDAIRNASQHLNARDLPQTTLYSSMEPCLMCFSACYWAKIEKVVYAVAKTKLPAQHYEGLHDLVAINETNNRQMTLMHLDSLEKSALAVIHEWEQKL